MKFYKKFFNRRLLLIGFSLLSVAWFKRATGKAGGVMFKIRRSQERGFADHGWLRSLHTFSFANYYDPQHMGFRNLRVINEDRISGGSGFGMHGHRDMEIISYVVQGSLEHKDSKGNVAIIRPGEVQRMSAGGGVMHSEYNHSASEEAHFFQIWITPDRAGTEFSYGQKSFEAELNSQDLVLVVSKTGRNGSISINQDVDLYASRLRKGKQVDFNIRSGRHIWLQVVKGKVQVNETELAVGDAISSSDVANLQVLANEDAEFLLFDLN